MANDPLEAPVREVTCPRCARQTDRVQSYEVPVVLFVLAYIVWTHERVAGCPACVRSRLWRLFLLSIPMANIFFPIIGTLILWDIWSSHRRDEPGIAPELYEWARLSPPRVAKPGSDRGKALRLLVVLLFLVGVLVVVFLVLPRLAG
jgi:hypothetical protein